MSAPCAACEATLSGLHVFKPRYAQRERPFTGWLFGERDGVTNIPLWADEVECLCGAKP